MHIAIERDKKAKYYDTDILIYPAAIHYLLVVAKANVINVTDIADKMQVTKGAVSQIITRLQKKG